MVVDRLQYVVYFFHHFFCIARSNRLKVLYDFVYAFLVKSFNRGFFFVLIIDLVLWLQEEQPSKGVE